MRKQSLLVLILLYLMNAGFSQHSNLRQQRFATSDSIKFDTVPVLEGSLIVRSSNKILPDSVFRTDTKKGLLILIHKPVADSISITWRAYPEVLYRTYYHKSKKLLQTRKRYQLQRSQPEHRQLFEGSQINRSGSISRGFTLGNNQDVTMNSSLNLQLSGKLTDELSVVASITDSNIPVQPEGNTQQLQEFDKIFIRVFNEKINLILGDYNLQQPNGTFLNVNKKLQGMQVTNHKYLGDEKRTKITNTAAGAVSKGKYFRQQLSPVEGNQGPYKLKGANGERFIIVIAGSEKVYIDGEQLKRGQQHDYTIDYNSAEVTFNPAIPITNDMRIYVEFEYTDKKYTRFLVSDFAELQHENTRIWMNVISESDSKNQPVDQELDSDDIAVLENVGDNVDEAIVPNITEQEYDEDMILYAKRDSTVNGETYEVYYYSNNPDSAQYRLGFSLVGEQNGHYIQTNNLANGKVYRWVAPVDGTPQGSYEPVVKLTAPRSQQMVTTGVEVQHAANSTSRLEVGWSHHDVNTFSNLDQNNDNGLALQYQGSHRLSGDSVQNFQLNSKYQFVQNHFTPFERFRATEFERDWNARNIELTKNQHLAGLSLKFQRPDKISADIGAASFIVPDILEGLKGSGNFAFNKKWLHASGRFSYLRASTDSLKSNFIRSKSNVGIPFWELEAGARQELEMNTFRNQENKLSNNSYNFYQYETYITNNTIEGLEAELSGNYRIDHQAWQHEMTPEKARRGITLSGKYNQSQKSTWRLVTNYREVTILSDSLVQTDIPEQQVSTRIENRSALFNGIIRSNTFYEVSTGLESKKEYAYLEVEKGQGNYIWIDRNDNGVKELNEFEIAQIAAEADHIRMYIPTDEYISVYANQFKQKLNINFRKYSVSKNQWLKLLSRFSNRFSYAVNRKVTDDDFTEYANPFSTETKDSTLVSTRQSVRNMFSFNKTNPKFGADIIINQTKGKNLLTSGFEGRANHTYELQTRWNITQYLTLLNTGSIGEKSKTTEYFTANNYKIKNYKAEVTLRLQPKVSYRIEAQYTYDRKKNIRGEAHATHHDGGVNFQYAAARKSSINASFHYIDVTFNGSGNNSLTYELLNGLQKGANYTWELNWNRRLSENFQMSIRYNGRAGDNSETIHIGSMRVRAMF